MRVLSKRIWPYYIFERDGEQLKDDLQKIIDFISKDWSIDVVIFVPNAGLYLHELFTERFGDKYATGFITIRRAATLAGDSKLKAVVFRYKVLSDFARHVEVALRLVKYFLKLKRDRRVQDDMNISAKGKNVLLIDDSVDSGSTIEIGRRMLIESGAQEVKVCCVSNHLYPRKIKTDYSVYEYALLRTKNSRDYAGK